MSITIAAHVTNPGSTGLHNFNDTIVVKLPLAEGRWVLFGRVVITNWDSTDQNVSAMLRHDDGVVIDQADARIGGGGPYAQSFSLQAPLTVRKDIIDIACSTYNGSAQEVSLIAVRVDELEPPVPPA